ALTTSRSTTVAMSSPLADPRKLLALQHVDDPTSAHAGPQHDESRRVVDDCADNTCVAALGMATHRGQDPLGIGLRYDRQHLALVGDVERIEAEQLTHAADRLGGGDGGLVQYDPDARPMRNLLQPRGATPP